MSKNKYIVKTGENIYDIALTLYGSIEGIFDLLVSNDNLTMDTRLQKGDELYYHDEFMINQDVAAWVNESGLVVKNGDHQEDDGIPYEGTDMRIIVRQRGGFSSIGVKLLSGTMYIDWGDMSGIVVGATDYWVDADHNYQDIGEHIIRISGDFEIDMLDFTELNGVYYALTPIHILSEFNSNLPTNEELNALFIINNEQVE